LIAFAGNIAITGIPDKIMQFSIKKEAAQRAASLLFT